MGRNERAAATFVAAFYFFQWIPAPTWAAEPQRALLPWTVNGVDRGTVLALVAESDVLLRVSDLEAARLHGFAGRRAVVEGEEFVSLASLAPDAAYELDGSTVSLGITVPAAWLGATVLDMSPGRPGGIAYSNDTSAFFNYAFNERGNSGSDAFGEAGLSVNGDLVYSSVSRTADGRLVRGLSNYTHDDRERMQRWVVGDTFATAGGLGGSLFLGGVSLSRNFDLDPYFIRTPTLGVSGATASPSTVDVIVNGSVVRREQIPPGTFDVTNLPVPAGSGTAQVVVRDAFGQERTLSSPFYASTSVLARGLREFSAHLGFRRDSLGAAEAGYGAPALLGWFRMGWTDHFTPGVRFEADRDIESAGMSLAARFRYGEIETELAASRDTGRAGTAGSIVYRYLGSRVNFGVLARTLSDRYANLALRGAADRPTSEHSVFAGARLGPRATLTAQYSTTQMRDAPAFDRASLSGTLTLSRWASAFLSGGRVVRDGTPGTEAFCGVSFFVGRGTLASVSEEWREGAARTSIEVQKSLPLGTGFGYRAQIFEGDQSNGGSGSLLYQSPFGRYEARYDRVGDEAMRTLSASGGVVAIGGSMAFTRAVGQSFGVIRVPDVAGVMGLSSNQPVARTNRRGEVFVPDLVPYYGNRLGIVDRDLPLDYRIDGTERLVAPPYRGGALVTFPVKRIRIARGALSVEPAGQLEALAFGEIAVMASGRRYASPIGAGGEFEFEGLPAGRHVAVAESPSGRCFVELELPPGDEAIVDVGTPRCVLVNGR